MPVRSTTYDNRRLPPTVSRQWNNQSQVAERPDPNNGMEVYQRNNGPAILGQHGGAPTSNPMNDQRAPLSLVGLDMAANATDQGYREAYDRSNAAFVRQNGEVQRTNVSQADSQRLAAQDRMRQAQVKIMDPNARRYTQALKNVGAEHLRTGATHEADPYQGSSFGLEATADTRHRDKPGFFDVQDHDYLAKLQRLDQLALSDYTRRSR